MTRELLNEIENDYWNEKADPIDMAEVFDLAIKALEQTDKIEESNFSTEQYKADLQGAYDCGYNEGYEDAKELYS